MDFCLPAEQDNQYKCGEGRAFLQLNALVASIHSDTQRTAVWTAVNAVTKIILRIHMGQRLIDDAFAFVHGLQQRLAPDSVPSFSSDGLRHEASNQRRKYWCRGQRQPATPWTPASLPSP